MNQPPKLAERLLAIMARSEGRSSVLGDFAEIYDGMVKEQGTFQAKAWYWSQVLKSFPMFLFNHLIWRSSMFKNYMLIAFRNIFKQRIFSFINILGLAIGLTLCLFVINVVFSMYSSDRFHAHKSRIYRVTTTIIEKNGESFELAAAPFPVASVIRKYPEVEAVVRLKKNFEGAAVYQDKSLIVQGYYVDENYFDVFSYNMIWGDPASALQEPYSVVIKQTLAEKFFNQKNPIGKTLHFPELGEFKVTGVLKDDSKQLSHMKFEILASLRTLLSLEKEKKIRPSLTNWRNVSGNYIYVLMREGLFSNAVKDRFPEIVEKNYANQDVIPIKSFQLQALTDISPGKSLANPLSIPNPPEAAYVLSFFAFIILLTACFNYTHLSFAKALIRAKEVGIRKVIGANRAKLFTQFIGESVVMALIALIFAVGLLPFLEHFFMSLNDQIGLRILIDHNPDARIYLVFLGVSILTGILAGFLPALYMSRFRPARILRDISQPSLSFKLTLRRALVVAQFCVSLILVIFLIVGFKQTRYLAHLDFGFDFENILNVEIENIDFERFKQEIIGQSGVLNVSASGFILGTGTSFISNAKKQGSSESYKIHELPADENFIDTMGLDLLTGKNFPPSSDQGNFAIINEKAVTRLGFESPAEALGKNLTVEESEVEIIGVVQNFITSSVSQPVEPLVLRVIPKYLNYANIKLLPQNKENTIQFIKERWKEVYPLYPISYRFHKDQINDYLDGFKMTLKSIGLIAFLAIFIAFFGLIGMVVFDAESRVKEIGIRKVLGAGDGEIMWTLAKGFIRLMILAAVLAAPIAWMASYIFLRDYHNRVNIGVDPFFIGIGMVFVLGFSVILLQAARASRKDPIISLRNE